MPFALCCKNTKSLKDISSLNNSSPRLPPSIPPLAPSSSSSSPVNIRGLAQMSEGTVLQSCAPELRLSTPQSCTLERRKAGLHIICLIFYFCHHQRNMQKGLLCCILNALLHFLSAYAHEPRTTLFPAESSMPNFKLETFFFFFVSQAVSKHFWLLLKTAHEPILAEELCRIWHFVVTVRNKCIWMLLKLKPSIFLPTAKCNYMGQTFSEGQHFLSRSCRECKVIIVLVLHFNFASILPVFCNRVTIQHFFFRINGEWSCVVNCSQCYSISQQALLAFPPSPNLFNLPFFFSLMVR